MRNVIFTVALAAATLSAPLVAQAQILQGTSNGAQEGIDRGNAAAGPLGGIVGGAIGAGVGAATGAVGTASHIVGGIFGSPDDGPRFHDYAIGQHRRSFAYQGDVAVGMRVPGGVALYPVPRDYHIAWGYRYAMVNDRTVIVDPRTRRVVDVID